MNIQEFRLYTTEHHFTVMFQKYEDINEMNEQEHCSINQILIKNVDSF